VDPASSPTFLLPRDPVRHPLVIRSALPARAGGGAGAGAGAGAEAVSLSERYVVGDIVVYEERDGAPSPNVVVCGGAHAHDSPPTAMATHKSRPVARICEFFR
jgi:hypothetical protein